MESISKNYILTYELFSEEGALEFLEATVNEMEKGILENYYNLEYSNKGDRICIIKLLFMSLHLFLKLNHLLRRCMNINPRYEWLNYALADIYKLKKEYKKMFEIAKNMAALDPHNDQKQLKLALAAISMKKEDIVKNALEEIRRSGGQRMMILLLVNLVFETSELYFIVQAYQEVKDFQKVIYYLNQVDYHNS